MGLARRPFSMKAKGANAVGQAIGVTQRFVLGRHRGDPGGRRVELVDLLLDHALHLGAGIRLVLDLVVSSTLMSMGMVMLPPVFISLPFKILLFVLVDGWNLVTRSLVESFH